MIKKKKPTYVKVIAIIGTIIAFSNIGRVMEIQDVDLLGKTIPLVVSILQVIAFINIVSFSKWAINLLFATQISILILNIFNPNSVPQSYFQPIVSTIFWIIIYNKNKVYFK
jgi:hypothetical protein